MNARTTKIGRAEALRLARRTHRVAVAKGRRVYEFDMRRDPPPARVLAAALLGPTGNLRAPAAVINDTLVVGFTPELYAKVCA